MRLNEKDVFMKKLKTCIIGCGNIFPMHAVSVTRCPETELVAVCDVKEDRAKAKAEEFGCKYYLDYKEMIDKEQPDVVHLCLPHYLHPIVAIYCEERGINVLTEKPMSIELKDAKAMIETVTMPEPFLSKTCLTAANSARSSPQSLPSHGTEAISTTPAVTGRAHGTRKAAALS